MERRRREEINGNGNGNGIDQKTARFPEGRSALSLLARTATSFTFPRSASVVPPSRSGRANLLYLPSYVASVGRSRLHTYGKCDGFAKARFAWSERKCHFTCWGLGKCEIPQESWLCLVVPRSASQSVARIVISANPFLVKDPTGSHHVVFRAQYVSSHVVLEFKVYTWPVYLCCSFHLRQIRH